MDFDLDDIMHSEGGGWGLYLQPSYSTASGNLIDALKQTRRIAAIVWTGRALPLQPGKMPLALAYCPKDYRTLMPRAVPSGGAWRRGIVVDLCCGSALALARSRRRDWLCKFGQGESLCNFA